MGEDSVKPFLQFEGKWAIVLGLTSNPGAADFELQDLKTESKRLYELVISKVATWGTTDNLMFVVGATRSDEFINLRKLVPNHFFLVPWCGSTRRKFGRNFSEGHEQRRGLVGERKPGYHIYFQRH